VPAVLAGLEPIGRPAATTRLNLAIGLPLRNQQALAQLVQQLSDPAHPDYRHYLTPEEFAARFGPTEQDYQAVIAFAQANGLAVSSTHPNRALLDVGGSVADIEKALHLTMRTYRHPAEARTFYAPEAEPSLDLAVPVLRISGLDNYSLPRPRLQATPLDQLPDATPNSGSGPSGTYMGNDFRAAYLPGVALTGSGQTVGLLQFDGYNASDIASYESRTGLPNVPLSNVLVDGATGHPSGGGGEVEVSLDIEMAISMAPGLSGIIVYMAPNPSPFVDLLNRMATDNLAKQLSCSWYIPGGGPDPVADQIFQQMAAQGQSFFNASGDYDAFTGPVDFPGETPYIVQVGGDAADDERCWGPLAIGDGLEPEQRHRHRRWDQHPLCDSELPGRYQHDPQSGLDHEAQYPGCGADGGQCVCAGQRTGLQCGRDQLRRAVVGRVRRAGQSASRGRREAGGGIY
jgi:subtilase family serine protease